jgi:hypothetical protein
MAYLKIHLGSSRIIDREKSRRYGEFQHAKFPSASPDHGTRLGLNDLAQLVRADAPVLSAECHCVIYVGGLRLPSGWDLRMGNRLCPEFLDSVD